MKTLFENKTWTIVEESNGALTLINNKRFQVSADGAIVFYTIEEVESETMPKYIRAELIRLFEEKKAEEVVVEEQPKRFFVVTGIEDEYGWLLETGSKKWYNLEEGEVEVFNPLGNGFSPEIYQVSDVTEISKENYDKLMQVHIDSAEEGWGAEEDEKFQSLLKEILGGKAEDKWYEFENEETGCKVTARTFTIDGEKRTVVLDNFSDYPFSIQNFDLGAFEVEEDWSNIYENPHVELIHGQHEILEKYLSPEDWKLVVMQLEWEYGIEVSTWDYDNQVPMQRTMTKLARVKLFERYNDLLMKSLKEGLDAEENTEYYMLYDELSLKEGENIYNLMKEMYEVRGVAQ